MTFFQVIGVDISKDMTDHCQKNYGRSNLSFQALDSANNKETSSFLQSVPPASLLTCLSTIHWVQDHAKTVQFFNRALGKGGKLVVVAPDELPGNNYMKKTYLEMASDPRFSAMMANVKFSMVHYPYMDPSWMKSSSEFNAKDFSRLLEQHGFRIDLVTLSPVQIWLEKERMLAYLRHCWLPSWPVEPQFRPFLVKAFMERYESNCSGSWLAENYTMMQLFATKIKDV